MHSDQYSQQPSLHPPSGLPPADPEALAYWAPAAAGSGHPPAQAPTLSPQATGSWVGTQHQPPADPSYAPWTAAPQPPADQINAPWIGAQQQPPADPSYAPWTAVPQQPPADQTFAPPWAAAAHQPPADQAAAPWAGAPQQTPGAPWAGAPHQPPPYLVIPTAEPGRVPPGRRTGSRAAVIVATALAVLAGAGAYAADTWAKSEVCDAVQALTKARSSTAGKAKSAAPTQAEFDAAEDGLNNRARLLFFHADLRDATHGLADDLASIGRFQTKAGAADEAGFTEMLAVAASTDSHARKAQRACGLPVRSLFNGKTK